MFFPFLLILPLCFVSSIVYSWHFPILVDVYRPLPPGGNPFPINKHLIVLNELIGNADTVRFIKSRRMAWLGHVTRMDGGRMPSRILEWKPVGRRITGRPRKRWSEDAEEDIQTMGIRGWRKLE
jgi:hypothetical protein